MYLHFQKQDPAIKINSITIAQEPHTSSTVNIEKEGARRGYNMMVNPYTAEVLPEVKGREFFNFIQQLHRNLTTDVLFATVMHTHHVTFVCCRRAATTWSVVVGD